MQKKMQKYIYKMSNVEFLDKKSLFKLHFLNHVRKNIQLHKNPQSNNNNSNSNNNNNNE